MIAVIPYTHDRQMEWDAFVARCRNGLFIFRRGYMDYHTDRFTDESMMFYDQGQLVGLLPANLQDDVLSSHAGLTFGGVLSDDRMTAARMLDLFDAMRRHACDRGIGRIYYKAVPALFSTMPAQEDLYALFRANARLVRRDLSSAIRLDAHAGFAKSKRQGRDKATAAGLAVVETLNYAGFIPILESALAVHGVRPTHTLAELLLLSQRFPQNMRLFAATDAGGCILAGAIVYEYGSVAHTQYMANGTAGRELGALDLVIDHLLRVRYVQDKEFISFGVSTEQDGRLLNAGLQAQKEMFGARAIVHDHYLIDIE